MDIFKQNNAKAIWIDTEKKPNRYACFQREFNVTEVSTTSLYICTDTKYEIYINGSFAGFGQYEDLPNQKIYDEHDITPYINKGSNLISILAYSQGEHSFQHISGLPMVIFTAVSGGKCILASDENTKCRNALEFISGEFERITPQRSFNFGFDLRLDDDWKRKSVCQSWHNAVVCNDESISYLPRPIEKLILKDIIRGKVIIQGLFSINGGNTVAEKMQYASLAFCEKDNILDETAQSIKLKQDNVYWIADLGRETAGYIALDIEAEDGAILDIACGEHLTDLRVRSSVGGRNFAFRCACRKGRQQIRFYIRRIAGRYLQFFAQGGIKEIHCAGLHETEYPLCYEGKLCTNDRLFNKIYNVSMDTLKLCMHEHYEDCPQREQALYGGDGRNQMLTGYYAFGETAMPRASLELLGSNQRENGMLEICSPCIFEERTIPSFALSWVIALKEYTLFTGDFTLAEKMFPNVRKLLNFFAEHKENGVLLRPHETGTWNFYEWTNGMENWDDNPDIKADAPLNSYYIIALKAYAQICLWLGKNNDYEWADSEYKEISNNFHKTFYCEEKGAYQSYIGNNIKLEFSQLTQALALVAGCVPENFRPNIRKLLLSDELVETSLSYLIYKYDALMQEGEKYFDYILNDIERQWGYMLYSGATSFWETILGEADFDNAGSLCHGWSAVPIYVFWRYIMGIYPTDPGFTKVTANPPVQCEINATGELKTPAGIFSIKKEKNKFTVTKLK